ncbi:putative wall-associated receptor kinase, galacturonan-binding domain-containing protein [Helianthus annuus]|nr:putative wall-associated receptor kinase, galacturonan-binding domain-containing protein [Helianthus annuus]
MKLFILLFLSLTPAIAKYVKTGCSDKCGNVRIPYPFGIGAECSVNQWYTVDCKNSSPYLSKLNHLEVLGISLKIKQSLLVCQGSLIAITHFGIAVLSRASILMGAPSCFPNHTISLFRRVRKCCYDE